MQELARRYDKISNYFLQWTPSPQFQKIMNIVLLKLINDAIKRYKAVKILDVGCGHGTWIKYILNNIPDASAISITGIDISKKRIQIAKSMLADKPNISLIAMDFMEYKPTEKFDIIFIAEVLQLIEEKYYEKILQKCYSILASPGFVVIVDRDRISFHYLKFLIKRKLKRFPKDYLSGGTYEFIRFPSFKKLSCIAKENNFSIVNKVKVKEFHSLVLFKNSPKGSC
jgi:2-polyprenyl-3-methyl-5-hydroxy-6-metoxy-1,4-benzoquinol methylase